VSSDAAYRIVLVLWSLIVAVLAVRGAVALGDDGHSDLGWVLALLLFFGALGLWADYLPRING
jgi:hypothetical protein